MREARFAFRRLYLQKWSIGAILSVTMTIRQTAIAVVSGIAFTVVGLTVGTALRDSDAAFFLLFFGLVSGVVVSVLLLIASMVAVHEAGHWIALRIVGYRLAYLGIGKLTWTRFRGRYLFREGTQHWLHGLTQAIVPADRTERWRYLLFVASGACAQLMVIGALLLAMALLSPKEHPIVWSTLMLIAVFHGLFVIGSLVPYRERGRQSDGLHLYSAWKRWPNYVRAFAAERIWSQMRDLVPVEQLNEDDIALSLSDPSDLDAYVSGLVVRFCQQDAAGRTEEALETIQKAMAITPIENRFYGTVRTLAVYAYAWLGDDAARANDALMSLPTNWPENIAYLTAKAALRFAQGNHPEAAELAERAIANATETPGLWQAYPQDLETLRQIVAGSRAAEAASQP